MDLSSIDEEKLEKLVSSLTSEQVTALVHALGDEAPTVKKDRFESQEYKDHEFEVIKEEILELLNSKDSQKSQEAILSELGWGKSETEEALKDLLEKGLIALKEGVYQKTGK